MSTVLSATVPKIIILVVIFLYIGVGAETQRRKIPTVSYDNVVSCFPSLKDSSFEAELSLDSLKKRIDGVFTSKKSVLRYRNILIKSQVGTDTKRLVIGLKRWEKGHPVYQFYTETIKKGGEADLQQAPKDFLKAVPKDLLNSNLAGHDIIDDESSFIDTKPNKIEFYYKLINNKVSELELNDTRKKQQLKCELKQNASILPFVLCLCLKR